MKFYDLNGNCIGLMRIQAKIVHALQIAVNVKTL
ncbi:hypothetical protein BAC3_01495 [uncultured bacterium]|nr:hypothetical protein BAC3_01495 [uncultured bacterium]